MAPVALSEVPPVVNTNGPDGAVREETHLKDPMGAGQGDGADEPDKENVLGRREEYAGTPAQATIPDDLFDDDSDEDENNDFVPRGDPNRPTRAPGTPARPQRKPTGGASQAADRKDGATAMTETTDTKAQKKDTNAQKKDAKAQKDAKAKAAR